MANVNGREISLKPTAGMKAEAQRYRDWKKKGTPVALRWHRLAPARFCLARS